MVPPRGTFDIGILAGERGEEREHHVGHQDMDEGDQDGRLGIEDAQRFGDDAEPQQRAVHRPFGAQQDDPAVGANDDAAHQRGYHQEH